VEAAVNLSTLAAVPLILAGAKTPVTPEGSPETERATADVKPFCGVAKTLIDVEAPSATINEVKDGARAKFGTGMVSEKLTVFVSDPLTPVTVKVYDPPAAVVAAVNFSALTAVPLMLAGVKVAVTPAGRPETESATAELKPFCGVSERFNEAVLPGTKDSDVALTASAKLGAVTTTAI
jgi:hypothetical protein